MRNYSAQHRDEAEPAIVAALERMGCRVERVNGLPFDLLVLRAERVFLLEVKSSARAVKRKSATAERQAAFRRRGWPVHIVIEPIDALRVVGLVGWRAVAARRAADAERAIAATVTAHGGGHE